MSGTVPVQKPRLQLLINGVAIPALSAEVNSNNYYHADSFKATLLPDDPTLAGYGLGRQFWGADATGGTNSPVMVTVQVDPGLAPQPNWTTLIVGRVDSLSFDPIGGELEIEGRDRTADLIEYRTFQTFKNQTSSQIATTLAGMVGLTAQVTATTTPVERYYSADHDKITLGDFTHATTAWDLLTFLAQEEGFDAWVSGNTLYFQKSPPITQNPLVFDFSQTNRYWTANLCTISQKRALTLARDIQVTVQSWSSKAKSGFKVTAKATGVRASSAAATAKAGSTTTQNYVFTRPNLTKQQALAFAKQKLAELSLHERGISIEMPGDVTTIVRQGLQIIGTGTQFDITYYITEINRTIDADGFRQTVYAKNQSPKNTSTVG
jgi:phage protein D